ncbi:hypothetical protein DY037_05510 [Apilactobacillus micheneri]|uniref:HU family DNA-binding protein n=1 Tax=Apilactobacillus TaxID=2767877 RepID=UPI00112D57AC|nr:MULTISPECIES: HU family DNA-binding protein [Apilactobacillus]TPR13030.1 hypothetical protein DY052_08500 [Apilactobacillus timberlakei]TPR49238.1 hypothetical protein DY037_05510 [Apilactobacillus micheneri]
MADVNNKPDKISRKDLVQLIYRKELTQNGNIEKDEIENIIKEFLLQITKAVARGDQVNLFNFGSFTKHYMAGRKFAGFKNIKMVSKAHYVPKFKPGKDFKRQVNEHPTSQQNLD